jgi:phosphatidate phosphatase APP1
MCVTAMLGQAAAPADVQVILFPTAAAQEGDPGQWVVPIHGWAFQRVIDERQLWIWEKLFQLDEELSRSQRDHLRRRLNMFLVDNLGGAAVEVAGGQERVTCPPAEANGHFRGEVKLSAGMLKAIRNARVAELTIEAVSVEGQPEKASGRVHLVMPTGISVICDIDDTIRASGVGDHEELFKSTFLEKYEPVSGMPGLLRHWKRKFNTEFHYVSVCPWQFYPDLEVFFAAERIPAGSFHLKAVRLKDESFMNLFAAPDEHKNAVIGALLERFPGRRFVLLGDASERDPEIYGRLAREHGEQIAMVLIRDRALLRDTDRYQAAFQSLPESRYRLFRDPAEIRDVLRNVPPASQPR